MAAKVKATGKGWSVQLRVGQGRRPSFLILAPTEAEALERAEAMAAVARLLVEAGRLIEAPEALKDLGATESTEDFEALVAELRSLSVEPVPAATDKPKGYAGMTFLDFGREWTSGRMFKRFRGMHKIRAKKPKSQEDDQRRIEFVASVVGPVLMRDFSLDHFEAVMAAIPDSADSDSSRRAVAQVMSWLLRRAVNLRVRTDFPLSPGSLPTVTSTREFQLVYPREDKLLMACPDVDLFDRAFYGFSVRNGCRKQNFLDLRWQDIDFIDGQVWVPDSKTGKPVAFDLEPGCVRALRALKVIADERWALAEGKPGAKVPASATIFPQWHPDTIAKRFRGHLKTALGPDARAQLFEETTHQRMVEFHDLRASFITFALANNRTEEWIRERSGHTTSQMIARYRRPRVSKLALRDWLPLDVALGLDALALGSVDVADQQGSPSVAEPEAHDRHDQGAEPEELAHSHPPASVVQPQPLAKVDDLGDALGAEPVAGALPAAHLPSQGAHEIVPALGPAELDELGQDGVGEGTAGDVGHGGAPFGVATGVATGFSDGVSVTEGSSMFSAGSDGTPGEIRTPDQRIRNPLTRSTRAHESEPSLSIDTRERTRALGMPGTLPMSALGEDYLAELAEVALAAKRWHLVAALVADLDAIAQARAAQSNVTHLGVERRKRSAS